MRRVAVLLGVVLLMYAFLNVSQELPPFGSLDGRVTDYYLNNGLHETGSANIVNAVVWEFRGFDTVGEETVLFSTAIGIFLIFRGKSNGRNNKGD